MDEQDRYGFGWRATGRSIEEAMRLDGREGMALRDFVTQERGSLFEGHDEDGCDEGGL